ncbi:MAG: DUF58 domain-containing protein [Alphaproteobacteria bacterium]|nr:DUF58 domain-containing protein [Alphaproteobacteria bacterium]MBV8548259.1 DUF58 domain-containing protein [Alphaproteobacteria bacterium]
MTASARLVGTAQQYVAQLPDLLLCAEHMAQSLWLGRHARRRAGTGDDFWQYRPYTGSDSAHRIDWRRSARGDTLYVREREWQITHHLLLWPDLSPSMDYASARNMTKADYAMLLTLTLSSLVLRAGDGVRGMTGPACAYHPSALSEFAATLCATAGSKSSPVLEGDGGGEPFVIASDFLDEDTAWDAALARLADRPRRGVLLHVMDPAEITLPFTGRARLLSPEGDPDLLVANIDALRDAYQVRMHAHQGRLAALAHAQGWLYIACVTDENPLSLLLKVTEFLSY